jgi:hypothetical protein
MGQPLRELGIAVILIFVAWVSFRETLTSVAATRGSSFALDELPYLPLRERLREAPRLIFAFDDETARRRAFAAQYALAPTAVVPLRLDHVLRGVPELLDAGIPILLDCSEQGAADGVLGAIRSHAASAGIDVLAEDVGDGRVFVKRAD